MFSPEKAYVEGVLNPLELFCLVKNTLKAITDQSDRPPTRKKPVLMVAKVVFFYCLPLARRSRGSSCGGFSWCVLFLSNLGLRINAWTPGMRGLSLGGSDVDSAVVKLSPKSTRKSKSTSSHHQNHLEAIAESP